VRLGNEERSNVLVPAPAVRLMKRQRKKKPKLRKEIKE